MGNAHSNHHHPQSSLHVRRKPSTAFSVLSLGCTSGKSLSSDDIAHDIDVSEVFLVSEKSRYRDEDPPYRTPLHPSRPLTLPTISPVLKIEPPSYTYAPQRDVLPSSAAEAYLKFLQDFPEYRLTWTLDSLRRSDYGRLTSAGETYVDYMGGALYPESLVRVHTEFLSGNVLGNTHSVSNSSRLSLKYADEARASVLAFFKAPPEYTVVFTNNATAALKLVGESYPFTGGSTYVLGADSHNSIHGIREFASKRNARVCYIPSTSCGGFDESTAKNILLRNRPRSQGLAPCLFALTGMSNITNTKNPLSMVEHAKSLGYHTLLDAAALATTTSISLLDTPVDAMAVSFYKMFGFPTGIGALVVKKSFLAQLQRPWFAGGTVDVVQVPGTIVTRSHELNEQFEDGTINYLLLPSVTTGIRFLSAYLPFLPLRLSALMHYMVGSLLRIKHDTTGSPIARILSRLPSQRLKSVGDQADSGSTISLIFLTPSGEMIPNSFIEHSATKQNISLRTGCMCNPGGAATILGIEDDMRQLYPGVTLKDFERHVGQELGVVRISLGLASNFQDVWTVLQFMQDIATEQKRQALWDSWIEVTGVGQAF